MIKVNGTGVLKNYWKENKTKGNVWYLTLDDGNTTVTIEKKMPKIAKITRQFHKSMQEAKGDKVGFEGHVDSQGRLVATRLYPPADEPLGFYAKGRINVESYRIDENNRLSMELKPKKKKGELQHLIDAVGRLKETSKDAVKKVLAGGVIDLDAMVTKNCFIATKIK